MDQNHFKSRLTQIALLFLLLVKVLHSQSCFWTFCQSSTWARKGCQPEHLYYEDKSLFCNNGDIMHHCCPVTIAGFNLSPPSSVGSTELKDIPNSIDIAVPDDSGICSWYGSGDVPQGAPTASGQRFDRYAMTAAHKTLPFGTKVRVTNLKNKLSVDVVINDRGPFLPRRILDLSYAAFGAIENRDKGLMHCSYTIL